MGIQGNTARIDRFAVLAIDVVYLDVIETIVEISHVQGKAIFIDFLINFHLVFNILDAARRYLALWHLSRGSGPPARAIRAMCLVQARVIALLYQLLVVDTVAA